jgi:nucleoporin NUP2
MDPPQKKRGLFGGITSSLFGRSYSSEQNGTTSSETTIQSYRRVDMPGATHSANRTSSNASPESPVKRASDAQLSSRKIIDRPARPSSKLSYSVNASDIQSTTTPKKTNFSSLSTSTSASKPSSALVRMPGDNPNKFNTISGSTFSRSTTRPTTDFSGTATTPRNLFRGSTLCARPSLSTFSPRVPYNTMESFPPSTPGRPPRGSTAEVNGRSLAHTNTSSLFEMRIPSPPRDLTGERLAKEVPEHSNRVGSVYADEFLAHYCPPDFDDLQRRQFFCVLDLRRLKYAANEIFAKKDWKINILNFAKEYEKSRSLIMLRYGLYEFKTVKASEAVKKQWQKEHGIPDSEDESDAQTYKSASGQSTLNRSKRKAEDELAPKETPLTASSSNMNKRRVTEPEPRAEAATPSTTKNKRKADSELDENQPSKLQKAAPASQRASATKSIFEKIANGTSNNSSPSLKAKASPKLPPSPLFGATMPASANGGRSILDQPSPAPSSNIFGHLSDASKASNDDEEDDSDGGDETASDADGEAEESEAQDASQSDEPSVVASGGVGTPQFGASNIFAKKAAAQAPSNTSSEAGDITKGRSLFDRVSYGNDGQPLRALGEVTPQPSSPEKDKPASPPRDQSSAPVNKTWNTDTPIKFAPSYSQPSEVFGSATPKAASSLFAQKPTASSSAPAITLEPPTPLKGNEPSKEADKPPAAAEQSKPASSSLFGAAPSAPASGASPFASGASTPFGGFGSKPSAGASVFGQTKPTDEKSTTTAAPPPSTSLFGAKPAGAEGTPKPASASIFGAKPATSGPEKGTPASTMFGAKPSTTDSESSKPAASPLFGAKPATSEETAKSMSTPTLFGAAPAASGSETPKATSVFQSSNLFGNAAKPAEDKPAATPATTLFGAATKPAEAPAAPSVGFSFGATAAPSSTAEQPAKPLFGATPAQSTSIFSGLTASKPSEDKPATPLFGATPAPSGASTPKPLFGAAPTTQDEPKQQGSIFANPFGGSTPAASETPFKFGQSQSTAPVASFGQSQTTAPAPSFGSQQQNNTQSTAPIFGGSAASSFTFGAGGGEQASFNNPFANGASSTPSSFNFGGNTDNNAGQSSTSPFSFGAGNAAPSISFGAGSGAGSGASTPNTQSDNMFGGGANGAPSFSSNFAFSGSQSQPNAGNIFALQPPAAGGLAPVGGTSTGTSKSYPSSTLHSYPWY